MPRRPIELTAREREVLKERTRTGSIDKIAKRLGISPETVDYHLKNIRRKFGIQDTGILLLEAHKLGLIDNDGTL